MSVPTVACTNCGKNFTTDDLRGTNCRYCGTLLAHHARAQQQVSVINQMMADRNGNGIPDAYEGLVANAQANAMNQAFGMGANPYYGQQQPYGGMGMMGGPQVYVNGVPITNPHAAAQISANVTKAVSSVMIIVVVSILLVTLLSVGIGVAVFFMS